MLDNPLPLSPETRDHFISIVLIRAITTDTSDILKTNNQQNIKYFTRYSTTLSVQSKH